MEKKKVYIAGMISGLPLDEARANFELAERLLIAEGFQPVNPMKLPHMHGHTWPEYMREDIAALYRRNLKAPLCPRACTRARLEVYIAEKLGVPVFYDLFTAL